MQDLLQQIATLHSAKRAIEAQLEPLREELSNRMNAELKDTGDMTPLEHEDWVFKLTKEPYSPAWLKRQYGYGMEDLPSSCVGEKIVPEIIWGAIPELTGEPLPITYSLKIERKKK